MEYQRRGHKRGRNRRNGNRKDVALEQKVKGTEQKGSGVCDEIGGLGTRCNVLIVIEHREEQIRKYVRRNIGSTVERRVWWMTDMLLRSE